MGCPPEMLQPLSVSSVLAGAWPRLRLCQSTWWGARGAATSLQACSHLVTCVYFVTAAPSSCSLPLRRILPQKGSQRCCSRSIFAPLINSLHENDFYFLVCPPFCCYLANSLLLCTKPCCLYLCILHVRDAFLFKSERKLGSQKGNPS